LIKVEKRVEALPEDTQVAVSKACPTQNVEYILVSCTIYLN